MFNWKNIWHRALGALGVAAGFVLSPAFLNIVSPKTAAVIVTVGGLLQAIGVVHVESTTPSA